MEISLRAATEDDVEALCDVYFSAFAGDLFSRQAFPVASGTGRTYMRQVFSEEMAEPDAAFIIATDPSSSTPDRIIGYVKWVQPGGPGAEYTEDGYPEDGMPAVASHYYRLLFEGRQRHMASTRHWYLDMMGVMDEYKGRGVGRQFVEWGLAKAKDDAVVIFVEAAGDAVSYYVRFGFRELDRMAVDTPQGTAKVAFMLHDAV